MVLVEPNEPVSRNLTKRLATIGIDANRVHVVPAGMCRNESQMEFFKPSLEKLIAQFPSRESHIRKHGWMLDDWGSFEKRRVKTALVRWLNSSDAATCVESEIVQCRTPVRVLEELGVNANDIVSTIVDAEGFDVDIVDELMAIDNFMPAILQFEWEHTLPRRVLPVMTALSKRGYNVHSNLGDIIALKVQTSKSSNAANGAARKSAAGGVSLGLLIGERLSILYSALFR